MRVLAADASLRTPNDEARLGWGMIGFSLLCWTVFMSVAIMGERYLPGYNLPVQ